MLAFIKSNLREAVAIAITITVLFIGILALGTPEVADSGPISSAVTLAVTLVGGTVKFAACLGLMWLGLLVTLPEAGKFTFSHSFDVFWQHCPIAQKGLICLIGTAVLGIVAALCMASS